MLFEIWTGFVFAWWILFPAYAANMFPPLARGKHPIDFGRNLGKHRLFGNSKTIEGFAVGVLAGTSIGALETFVSPELNAYAAQFGVQLPAMSLFIGFVIALGAMTGDLCGSFIKRRLGMQSSADAPLLDQLNFIVGALVFAYAFTQISLMMMFFMVVVTPAIHRLTCIAGYKLKLKKVPW